MTYTLSCPYFVVLYSHCVIITKCKELHYRLNHSMYIYIYKYTYVQTTIVCMYVPCVRVLPWRYCDYRRLPLKRPGRSSVNPQFPPSGCLTSVLSSDYRITGNFLRTNILFIKLYNGFYFHHTRVLRKLNLNEILQLLKNYVHVKLIFCKAVKKARMETKKQLLFPVAMGDEAIAITSSCVRGHLV